VNRLVGNSRAAVRIDALALQLPDSDPRKAHDRAAISALAQECGCSMGGAWFTVATVIAIAIVLATGTVDVRLLLLLLVGVVGAGLLGKLVGLGIARARLVWLGHTIRSRLATSGGSHVHMY
jgi:hypothetical protein